MSDTFESIMGEEYQDLSGFSHEFIERALNMIHTMHHDGASGDGGPVITGAISALIAFAIQGRLSDTELRAHFLSIFDEMLPKLRAQALMSGKPAGRA